MKEKLNTLKNEALEEISKCKDEFSINNTKSKYLGKKSEFSEIMSNMKILSNEEKKEVIGLLGELSDDDRISLISEVLNSLEYNFIVTPKEIDFQIQLS